MGKFHSFSLVVALLALSLFMTTADVLAQEKAPAAKGVASQKVKPGDLKGVLTNSKGKPLSQVQLTVTDAQGNVVSKAVTDKNGKYALKGLGEGKFTLYVEETKTTALEVTPSAKISSLRIVMPGSVKIAPPGMVDPTALTTLEWTVLVVGGVGVIVGVPAVVHHNESGDSGTVSP